MSPLSEKRSTPPTTSGYIIPAAIRAILCVAVLSFLLDNYEAIKNSLAVLVTVLVYLAIRVCLFIASWRNGATLTIERRFGTQFDAASFLFVSAISGGFTSPLNFLIFFVGIDVATGPRFSTSIKRMMILLVLFGLLSAFTLSEKQSFLDLALTLGTLTALGLGIAYRSGRERELKQQLLLTQQIATVASPRIGLDRAVGVSLGLLKDHFGIKDCLLLFSDGATEEVFAFRPTSPGSAEGEGHVLAEGGLFQRALSIPSGLSVIFYGEKGILRRSPVLAISAEGKKLRGSETDQRVFADVAELLDVQQFLSVPIGVDRTSAGRLFLLHSGRGRKFQSSDLWLVRQVAQSLSPLIENARLIDSISSNAAEEERKRIARDIHDSIIQPYLGMKLGLEAINQVVGEEDSQHPVERNLIRERLRNLMALADSTIDHLRNLVGGLADSKNSGITLLPSVRRFADKFAGATGIRVKVETQGDMRRADAIAADLFQLTVEGLSNIRKHTDSSTAHIEFSVGDHEVILRMSNRTKEETRFIPKSITERVSSLGGSFQIINDNGNCIVELSVPFGNSRNAR